MKNPLPKWSISESQNSVDELHTIHQMKRFLYVSIALNNEL